MKDFGHGRLVKGFQALFLLHLDKKDSKDSSSK